MTTDTIPEWPRIEAMVNEDGTGSITVNGTPFPVKTDSVDSARQTITERVKEAAVKLGRPVRVTTVDPDGEWPLVVHPDGTVSADPDNPARPNPQRVAPPAPDVRRAVPAEPDAEAPTDGPVPPAPDVAHQAPPGAGSAHAGHVGHGAPPTERKSFLAAEATEEPARKGVRGLLTAMGLRVSPSQEERSERQDVHDVSQHWPGPRTIAVVNGKGGAGKTPTTVLLSAVFARHGGAGVLAWDNNQTRGTLGWRTEQGPHESTLLDLLPETDRLLSTQAQSADLAHYVHHQTRDRYDVLRSKPMARAHEQRLDDRDVDAIHLVAAKYYRLIIMDSGNDESDPMWQRMIDHADQIVVATTPRDDHAEAGALLLEGLAQESEHAAHLSRNAVTLVTQADATTTRQELLAVARGYEPLARATVTIPFDPAMVDGVLRHGSLRKETQRAWLAAAAAVARGL